MKGQTVDQPPLDSPLTLLGPPMTAGAGLTSPANPLLTLLRFLSDMGLDSPPWDFWVSCIQTSASRQEEGWYQSSWQRAFIEKEEAEYINSMSPVRNRKLPSSGE